MHAILNHGLFCAARFKTAKLRTMKPVEVLKIVYVTAKLQDGAMRDETLVICVTAELQDAKVQGAMRSECDEMLVHVICVTAKRDNTP